MSPALPVHYSYLHLLCYLEEWNGTLGKRLSQETLPQEELWLLSGRGDTTWRVPTPTNIQGTYLRFTSKSRTRM